MSKAASAYFLGCTGHWVNKDASAWSKTYFDEKLTTISAEEKGVSVKVDKVLDVEGDVDVSQRKGKVITLFDVKIRLEFNGTFRDLFFLYTFVKLG